LLDVVGNTGAHGSSDDDCDKCGHCRICPFQGRAYSAPTRAHNVVTG
jgi:hypothetical protein